MTELNSKTRFLPPHYDARVPSPGLSPSRRGHRRYQSTSDDAPYDISPTSILQAFSENALPNPDTEEYKYLACALGADSAQKGLAIKAANVALGAKDWYLELRRWNWPGSFQAPSAEGGRETMEFRNTDGSLQRVPLEYWGCLPSAVVEAYETRVEEILAEIQSLDIEELKSYVLGIHGSRSRPSSSYERRTRATLNLMDDVSLLVTGTMVQALPVLNQLNGLLDTWSIRLAILRDTPRFLADLEEAKRAMQLAWDAIQIPKDDDIYPSSITKWKNAVDTINKVLESKVSSLGSRLDAMLDSLEGREDVIPDIWIDDFESAEADFGQWTGEARKKRIQLDWIHAINPKPDPKPEPLPVPIEPKRRPTLEDAKKRELLAAPEEDLSSMVTPTAESFPSPPTTFSPTQASHHVIRENPAHDPQKFGLAAPFVPTPFQRETSDSGREDYTDDGIRRSLDEGDSEVEPESTQWTPRARMAANMSPEHGWKRSGFIFANDSLDKYHEEEEDVFSHGEARPTILKRASTTSIESFTRDKLKAITLSRQNSTSSMASGRSGRRKDGTDRPLSMQVGSSNKENTSGQRLARSSVSLPLTREETKEEEVVPELPRSPLSRPQTPDFSPRTPPRSSSPMTPRSPEDDLGNDSPSMRPGRLNPLRAHPPLNAAVKKLRKPEDRGSESPSDTPPSVVLSETDVLDESQSSASPNKTRHARSHSTTSNAELNKQISEILSSVPANIRLTTGAAEATPSSGAPNKSPRSTSGSHRFSAFSAFRSSRSAVKSPEMTLSPVKDEGPMSLRKAGSSEHSDIKLYHLIQPGREKPIKLFIRRVGDNGERVMVRVGGGWADLGEYLRQYAEHHGRRAVSDGKFEVLGLNIDSSTGASSISPQVTPSKNASRSSSPLPGATPGNGAAMIGQTATPSSATAHLSSRLASESQVNTPDSVGSNTSRGSRRDDKDIGLAGPASKKKLDLSEEKLEWIDNMMSQARRISGGMKDGRDLGRDNKDKEGVQDLGRVGGTRRVFLKGHNSGRNSAAGDRKDGQS